MQGVVTPHPLSFIAGNSYGMFKIDKRSGEIKVQSKINSAMAGYYRLGIGVHDNGLPPHTVMSSVGIDVTKVLSQLIRFLASQCVQRCLEYRATTWQTKV